MNTKFRKLLVALGLIAVVFFTSASAQEVNKGKPEPAPAPAPEKKIVNLWPGVAPGSEHWTQNERTIENTPVGTVIMNVVTPTLTAYLPPRGKATGTGVTVRATTIEATMATA